MYTKQEVHILNVWTIIMQNLNLKKWKLLELQITQTRHPKSVADKQMDGQSRPTSRPAFTKAKQVNKEIYESKNVVLELLYHDMIL